MSIPHIRENTLNREKMKILLVDDDEEDYIITKDILSEAKGVRFDLRWENTYKNALSILSENQFDICLFDYNLGEKTGLELLQEAVKKGYKGPIIILTGQDDHEIDNEAIKTGASDYLIKEQISPTLIERSIRHALERKRSEDALIRSEERRVGKEC